MKTAIDDILEAYDRLNLFDLKKYIDDERGRLKEKEKQQIIEAYKSGEKNIDFDALHGYGKLSDSDKYYTNTFNQ